MRQQLRPIAAIHPSYNPPVPFTLAHGAAALPFRRSRLIISGVVVGTFAPDFEYFLRLNPGGTYGHKPAGMFLFTLPAGLVFLWLFHRFVKVSAVALLPDGWQRRLIPYLHEFRFGGAARFALIAVSVFVGALTHVAWDQFTHKHTRLYRHWAILRQAVRLPVLGLYPLTSVLQHGSTLIGLAILAIWLAHWYRTTTPAAKVIGNVIPSRRRVAIVVVITGIALVGATIRAVHGVGISLHHLPSKWFIAQFVITLIALLWWELVACGFYSERSILRS